MHVQLVRVAGAGPLAFGLILATLTPLAAQNFGTPELIEAARREGRLVYYTANFTEVEQETIKAFNKRFPFVKVELVRAPGGQLITRVKT
jgi:iron(III) transport system substrate-binding protein